MQITQRSTLTVLYSPDPDDAFAWWGLITGRTALRAHVIRARAVPLLESNELCAQGIPDVAAISSAAWPFFSGDYAVLSSGASVGRGYGPVLGARADRADLDFARARVAVPGNMTTGAALFRLLHPGAETVECSCSEVPRRILSGDVDAGVLIHEELMNWADRGLRRVACLGEEWTARTGLPIPVGLIAVHRRLGTALIDELADALRRSIHLAFARRAEATAWAKRYSRETHPGIAERFIEMFTNEDSLDLAPDCVEALRALYGEGTARGLFPRVPTLEFAGAPREAAHS
ncbi:MAG: 1,4-dihydroxy-6-naphthoate synthase [Candidatus Sumerlaeota bacterium]|nr:1,4-dihydroxy-6-naphthoate synthase [Candidatus Sumerlaeota bacterium]